MPRAPVAPPPRRRTAGPPAARPAAAPAARRQPEARDLGSSSAAVAIHRCGTVGRRGQGGRPGDRGEVLVPHLDSHGPAADAALPGPARGPFGQRQQLPGQKGRVGGVDGEGGLGADRGFARPRSARSVVTAPGEFVQPGAARPAEQPDQLRRGPSRAISPTVPMPSDSSRSRCAARRPTARGPAADAAAPITSAGGTISSPSGLASPRPAWRRTWWTPRRPSRSGRARRGSARASLAR